LTGLPILVLSLAVGSFPVELEKQDGSRVQGELIRLDPEVVELQGGPRNELVPTQEIQQIRLTGAAETAHESPGSIWVELTDGSRLVARAYGLRQQQATIQRSATDSFSIDRRLVRYVRYSAPQAELDRQWDDILQAKVAGDVLIVRRPNQILDYVVGQLGEIDEQKIQFQFDGNWIDVRPEKVDGIVPFQPNTPAFPAPKCRLTTRTGDLLQLQTFSSDGEQLRITSNNGVELAISLSQVESLRFGSSAVTYLSDIDPERTNWTPFMRIDALEQEMARLFQPRRDQSLTGGVLRIVDSDGREQEFEKGLSIHSRTEMTYRLAGEYRQFAAQAGLEPAEGEYGSIALVILVDGEERWRQEITGNSAAVSIDLDISGGNWLTILADYGERADVGDRLNLCDARLVK
jgi:hypothetical protein